MKLKMEKAKHDHKLTNLLKVALFTLLMFLPFINVGVRCAYVTLNKNAYQSYYGETINEEIPETINYKNVVLGNTYYYVPNANNYVNGGNLSFYIENLQSDYQPLQQNYDTIGFFKNGANYTLGFYGTGLNSVYININIQDVTFNFKLTGFADNAVFEGDFYIQEMTYNKYSYLDNVFEYSINQLEQNPLYNWALNTGIYTGIATMTGQLGITTTVIPMIITYWIMLTVIYIIIDIVIQLFVYLTHIFSKD